MTNVIFFMLSNQCFGDLVASLFRCWLGNIRIRFAYAQASSTELANVPKVVLGDGFEACKLFWTRPPFFMCLLLDAVFS
jgi:hypothetical protein